MEDEETACSTKPLKSHIQLFKKIVELAEKGMYMSWKEGDEDEDDPEANIDGEVDEEILDEDEELGVWVLYGGTKLLVPLADVSFEHPLQVSSDPFIIPEESEAQIVPDSKLNAGKREGRIKKNFPTRNRSDDRLLEGEDGYGFSSKRQMPGLVPDIDLQPVVRKSHTEKTIDFLAILPPELAWQVLSRFDLKELSNLMLVSKQWRSLALNPRLWAHLRLWCYRMTDETLDILVRRAGPWLRTLELPKHEAVGRPDTLVFMANHCTRIETLDVSLSARELKYLVSHFKNLRHMDIVDAPEMTSSDVVQIATLAPSLTSLTLWEITLADDEMSQLSEAIWALQSFAIFEYCPPKKRTLRKASLSSEEDEVEGEADDEDEEGEDEVEEKMSRVSEFSGIDDGCLAILLEGHKKTLKSVTLRGMKNITGRSMIALGSACKGIRCLCVHDCEKLSQWQANEHHFVILTHLEELDITGPGPMCDNMLVFVKKAPILRVLKIEGPVDSNRLVMSLVECTKLETLIVPTIRLSAEQKRRIEAACPQAFLSDSRTRYS